MSSITQLPKRVALAIMLLKALDLRLSLRLIQMILYLWRELLNKNRDNSSDTRVQDIIPL